MDACWMELRRFFVRRFYLLVPVVLFSTGCEPKPTYKVDPDLPTSWELRSDEEKAELLEIYEDTNPLER